MKKQTFKEFVEGVELFTFEIKNSKNKIQPPEGYFAVRSNKRRLFIHTKLYGPLFNIEHILASGEFIEYKI